MPNRVTDALRMWRSKDHGDHCLSAHPTSSSKINQSTSPKRTLIKSQSDDSIRKMIDVKKSRRHAKNASVSIIDLLYNGMHATFPVDKLPVYRGQVIRILRDVFNLSQEQLARKAELSQPCISRIESAEETNLSDSTINRICKCFNIDIVKFYKILAVYSILVEESGTNPEVHQLKVLSNVLSEAIESQIARNTARDT